MDDSEMNLLFLTIGTPAKNKITLNFINMEANILRI